MWEIPWPVEELLVCQEGRCSMEFVTYYLSVEWLDGIEQFAHNSRVI
jgi:hypothetical protein